MTFKEMCETIVKADFLRLPDGRAPTAEEIYNYSPTGELSMVIEWYHNAIAILAAADAPVIVGEGRQ